MASEDKLKEKTDECKKLNEVKLRSSLVKMSYKHDGEAFPLVSAQLTLRQCTLTFDPYSKILTF